MRALITATLTGLLLLSAVACGDDGATTGNPPPTTAAVEFGAGDQVWLQVRTGGGFVPYVSALREFPEVTLFDDGHLVRVTEDEQGAVPRLERVLLAEDDVADLLDRADAVVHGPDPGTPPVTDLPTTTITLTGPDAEGSLSAYALGFDEGLPPDQAAAREDIQALVDDLRGSGEGEPYVPDEWLVLTVADLGEVDVGTTVPWPLEAPRLAGAAEDHVCTRASTDELQPLLDALGSAEPFAYVATGDQVAEVALQPVITGDESCDLFEEFVER